MMMMVIKVCSSVINKIPFLLLIMIAPPIAAPLHLQLLLLLFLCLRFILLLLSNVVVIWGKL